MLDKLVSGTITLPWTLWNFFGSIAFWIFGMHIEMKRQQ